MSAALEPLVDRNQIPAKSRWRVAVLGSSLAILVVPSPRDRSDGAYPSLLERALVGRGHDLTVDCHARLYDLAHEGARRWREVLPTAPDVLVLHYGVLEAQPNVLPTWLSRHLTRTDPGGPGLRGLWVRKVVPRLWPLARAYQRRAAAIVGLRTWRLAPDRLRASLAHVVDAAERGQMLVLVLDVAPPGGRILHFLPRIAERIDRVNDVLRQVVDEARSPNVRLVQVSAIASDLGPASTPDGLHLDAEGHRRVALALADLIEPWLGTESR